MEHAQRLHDLHPERPTREENPRGFEDRHRGVPPGFPYEMTLVRESHWSLSPQHDGVLLVARVAPDEVEALRTMRIFPISCPNYRWAIHVSKKQRNSSSFQVREPVPRD